jgi:5-methylcytosine-specific restriction endonuclease McrA
VTRIQATGSENPSDLSDGILSAPRQGGVGGSALQAQGSEGENRTARRDKRKKEYELYLRSDTWKKIRLAVLRRDEHRCLTTTCERKATVVHHIRYPKVLGQEKLAWLYSLCRPCHDEIHRIHDRREMTLRVATMFVVKGTPPPLKKAKPAKKQKVKPQRRRKLQPAHVRDDRKKSMMLVKNNDELHEFFKRNRERRQARKDLETWSK